jgi:outer membrane protein OmpA-like peptidoglycan-associated protein
MMKQILFLSMLFAYTVSYAQNRILNDSINDVEISNQNNIRYIVLENKKAPILPIEDSLKVTASICSTDDHLNRWKSNWFLNASIGVGAFIGDPLGCEDLFGRTQPVFHTSIGKWFNRTIAGRISFQGFKLKNYLLEQQDYYHVHTDLLWNITRDFFENSREVQWSLIPYIGTGIVYNKHSQQHPFTLNYGLLNSFKIHDQISLSLELGGFSTFTNFDGRGSRNKFGDNLFHLSIGTSVILGRKELKHNSKRELSNMRNRLLTEKINAERKQYQQAIITNPSNQEIKYKRMQPLHKSFLNQHSLNQYSGLNSLRKRLSVFTDEKPNCLWPDSISEQLEDSETSNHWDERMNEERHLKVPILFFFQIGTTTLTDSSQLANLDEIAQMCKKHNRTLRVTGYADSATGNEMGNIILSDKRSKYIASELSKRGISLSNIQQEGKGGIDIYSPMPANRCVCIEIIK